MDTAIHLNSRVSEENREEDIRKIVKIIKPSWSFDSIVLKPLNGKLNRNYLCYHGNDKADIFVRIINENVNGLLQKYKNAVDFLHRQPKMTPPLLCTFENGECWQYIHGRQLCWLSRGKDFKQPRIGRMIAKSMARYHSPQLLEAARRHGFAENYCASFESEEKWDGLIASDAIPDRLKPEFLSISELRAEYDYIVCLLRLVNAQEALCHLDVNAANVLIVDEESEDGAMIMDYDWCRISLVPVDLSWYFYCFTDLDEPHYEEFPDDAYRKFWLREYLNFRRRLDPVSKPVTADGFVPEYDGSGSGIDPVSDEDVEKLNQQVRLADLISVLRAAHAGMNIIELSGLGDTKTLYSMALKNFNYYYQIRDDIIKSVLMYFGIEKTDISAPATRKR